MKIFPFPLKDSCFQTLFATRSAKWSNVIRRNCQRTQKGMSLRRQPPSFALHQPPPPAAAAAARAMAIMCTIPVD
jgi:hypothetical protein